MTLELREGLEVAERFRLERELGRGGMGSVWLARHTGLDILCAIKFIDQQGRDSLELRARFEREARSAAQLKSPHVVQILDYGVWQETPYIAMEYLEGEDLSTRLDRVWVLDSAATCHIVAQVAKALTKAHAAGIVHRDLKPENVFLVRDGDEEVAKVLDFGIAKSSGMAMTEAGTKTGSLLGTPFYMSPEQARGVKAIDHRSDLWSLAVIAYQCTTGQLPFESEGLGDVLAKIMYEPIPVPSAVKPDVPEGFDEWWKRASARKPEERHQSAKELSDELAVALGVARYGAVAATTIDRSSWGDGRTSVADSDSAVSLGGTVRLEVSSPTRTGSGLLTLAADTGSPLATTVHGVSAPPQRKRRLLAVVGLGVMAMSGLALLTLSSFESEPEAATTAPPRAAARAAPSASVLALPPAPARTRQKAVANPDATSMPTSTLTAPKSIPAPTTNKATVGRPVAPTATSLRKPKPPATKPGDRKKPVDFGI